MMTESWEFAGLEPLRMSGLSETGLEAGERAGKQSGAPAAAETGKEKEGRRMMNLEELAGMSLESLLYYVLAGEGRTMKESAVR